MSDKPREWWLVLCDSRHIQNEVHFYEPAFKIGDIRWKDPFDRPIKVTEIICVVEKVSSASGKNPSTSPAKAAVAPNKNSISCVDKKSSADPEEEDKNG